MHTSNVTTFKKEYEVNSSWKIEIDADQPIELPKFGCIDSITPEESTQQGHEVS